MRYAKIDKLSISIGADCRCAVYLCGCLPNKCEGGNCPNCHTPRLQSFTYSEVFTNATLDTLLGCLARPQICGISIVGGEPMDQDMEELLHIVQVVKEQFPEKTVWIYTGYQWEEIMRGWRAGQVSNGPKATALTKLLALVDVMVVGPYIHRLRDNSTDTLWRRSTNQRIIDVGRSLKAEQAVALTSISNNLII